MSEYRGGVHRGRRKHDGFDENMGPIHFGLERKSARSVKIEGGKKRDRGCSKKNPILSATFARSSHGRPILFSIVKNFLIFYQENRLRWGKKKETSAGSDDEIHHPSTGDLCSTGLILTAVEQALQRSPSHPSIFLSLSLSIDCAPRPRLFRLP